MGAGGTGYPKSVAGERDMVSEEETGSGRGGAAEYDGPKVAARGGEE